MANGSNWSSRKNAYYQQWRLRQKWKQIAQNGGLPQQPPQPQPKQQPQQPQQQPQQPQQPQLRNSPIINLQQGYNQTQGQRTQQNGERLVGVYQPGYDANGNAQVQKWQSADDNKAASHLGGIHKNLQMQNPSGNAFMEVYDTKTGQTMSDGYGFYPGDFQNFSLSMGLNAKPTVMSDAAFNRMVKSNNLQVIYRGDTGDAQVDRFMNAEYSHTGVGSYGDGFYFSDSLSTANDYAARKAAAATGRRSNGRVLKMALSPNARIISYSELVNKMAQASGRLQSSLNKAGQSANTGYLNEGQAQFALKLGYNVVAGCGWSGTDYHYALTRDAFIVSDKTIHAR